MFQVGNIQWLKKDDPTFEAYEDAFDHAMSNSMTDDGTFYGIWEYEDGELLAIIYEGECFDK